MRTFLTISFLVLAFGVNGQVFIDGVLIPPTSTYFTATFVTKNFGTVYNVYADAGAGPGTITDKDGALVEFTGQADLLNKLNEAGWDYSGTISVSLIVGKGISAQKGAPMPESALFRRR